MLTNDERLVYCKDCRNTIYETINDMPCLYYKVLKQYIGFYKRPCEHFQ